MSNHLVYFAPRDAGGISQMRLQNFRLFAVVSADWGAVSAIFDTPHRLINRPVFQ